MKADIFMSTCAKNDEGCDESEFFTVGEYEITDEGFVIRYSEKADMGYENCCVAITAKPELVIVERSGSASSMLYIDKKHKHECVYGTPYGDFTLGINTFEIDNRLGENGGTLLVRYGLDMNNDFISENKLHIKIEKKE